jgi:hypothetical protein
MSSPQKQPLITRPEDAIIDFSNQLDKSTNTPDFPYPVFWKPKKKYPKVSCTLVCCILSIVSTTLLIWGLAFGGFQTLND